MKIKGFDIRSFKRFFGRQAVSDLDRFMDQLPRNTGQTALIAAGIIWAAAAGLALMTMVTFQDMAELRAEMRETDAVQPVVPKLVMNPAPEEDVRRFAEKLGRIYEGIDLKTRRNEVNISADSHRHFADFREVMGHLHNGHRQWRVELQSLCVGRECERKQLQAQVKINIVSVTNPG